MDLFEVFRWTSVIVGILSGIGGFLWWIKRHFSKATSDFFEKHDTQLERLETAMTIMLHHDQANEVLMEIMKREVNRIRVQLDFGMLDFRAETYKLLGKAPTRPECQKKPIDVNKLKLSIINDLTQLGRKIDQAIKSKGVETK